MSDPTRIPRDEPDALLDEAHRVAAPPVPNTTALERVRVRAEALAAGRTGNGARASRPGHAVWRRPVVWRTALVTVSVVAALGASFALLGQPGDMAFAAEKLLAMLAPDGQILHYATTSSNQWVGMPTTPQAEMAVDYWIDAERKVLRSEARSADGEIFSITVESGGRSRSLSLMPDLDGEGDPAAAPTEWWLVEQPASDPLLAGGQSEFNPFWWLERLREAVASGEAEVTGTTTIDGEKCWELTWNYTSSDGQSDVHELITAVVRQIDYRPVRTMVVVTQDGRETARFEKEFVTWEVLPRSAVDSALLDRSLLTTEAAYDMRAYTAEDISDFTEFDGWWLGPVFDGMELTGSEHVDEDGTTVRTHDITYTRASDGWSQVPRTIEDVPVAGDGGELVAAYTLDPMTPDPDTDVTVTSFALQDEQTLEALVPALLPVLTGAQWEPVPSTALWHEVDGRRYVEYSVTGENGRSVAALNLGGSSVLVMTPDSETTARAIAALVQAN